MEELFSKTAYDRLPASIRSLPKETQTVCVFLRLRKTEEQITCETGFPAEKVSSLADEVRRTLIVDGKYDLVSEPQFTRIDDDRSELAAPETIDPEERMILDKFIDELEVAVSTMEERERKILHLYFHERMSVKEISEFLEKTGNGGGRVLAEIETAVKSLLAKLKGSSTFGSGILTVKALKDILNETGVGQ
jgi:DNA-directed RNA polymerase specialized sigma subunit